MTQQLRITALATVVLVALAVMCRSQPATSRAFSVMGRVTRMVWTWVPSRCFSASSAGYQALRETADMRD